MVGIGEMGRPMAERLLAAGHEVSFYARRPGAGDDLVALGAIPADSLRGLGAESEAVIVCVFSDDQVLEVCLGAGGLVEAMPSGSVLVNHTTGSPATAARVEQAAAHRGVRFLDAALSGGPPAVEAGQLTLMIGGGEEVLEVVRPVLAAYSDPILHVGRAGDGQRIKLVNNALFAAHIVLAGSAEQLARSLGVDPLVALRAITHCSGDSYSLRIVAATGSAEQTWDRVGRFIRKDVAMVEAVAADLGVDLGLVGTVVRSGPDRAGAEREGPPPLPGE